MTRMWLLLLVSLAVVASSRVYYVSPLRGQDSNDGSSAGPFKTLPRLMTELRASPIDTDITVHLLNGTHYLTTPLDFGKLNYSAAGSLNFVSLEKAAVSGAVKVNTTWTKSATIANVYTTKFTVGYPTHQLFVGNSAYSRRVRARSPNIDVYMDNLHTTTSPYYTPSVTHNTDGHVFKWQGPLNKTGLIFYEGDILDSYHNQNQVQVVAYAAWTAARSVIDTIIPENNTLIFQASVGYAVGSKGGRGYYIENCLECLDNPGEWYYDDAASTLYYYPLSGEDPNALDMYLTVALDLFSLVGTGSNIVKNVNFKGITFKHTEWACTTCDGQSASFLVRGAIKMSYVSNITIEECEFSQMGEYAIVAETSVTNVKINKNHFFDLAAGGIKLGTYCCGPQTSFVTITNNYIHGGSRVFQAGTGILIQVANNITVANNEISDMFYSGVCVGWNWGYSNPPTTGNVIENNYIHHIGQGELSDMAGIYTLGRQNGTRLRYNRIHDVLSSNYGAWGLYLDEGSSYIDVSHNIVYNTEWQSFHLHYGSYNHIFNNLLIAHGMGNVKWSKNDLYYAGLWDKNIFVNSATNTPIEGVFSDSTAQFDFGANLYVNISCGSLLFPNSFQDWQANGRDVGSKYVNAPSIDDIKTKIAYYNTLPAASSIGWEAIPLTAGLFSTDGLIKGSNWVSLPTQFPFPTQNPSSYVYPALESSNLGKRDSYETESTDVPKVGKTNYGGGAYIGISNEQAVNPSPVSSNINAIGWDDQDMVSKRSLKIMDTDNTSVPVWYPYYEIFLSNADQYFFYSSDVFLTEGSGFVLEFRHPNGSNYNIGPTVNFAAKTGVVTLKQGSTAITGPALATNEWIHVELLFGLGDKSNGSYVITYWPVKQPSSVGKATIPFLSPYFALGLGWIGYISSVSAQVYYYVDNVIFGNVLEYDFEVHPLSTKPLVLPNANLPMSLLGASDVCGLVFIVHDTVSMYAPYYFRRSIADLADLSSVSVELLSIPSGSYNVTVVAIDYKHVSIKPIGFSINIENPLPTSTPTIGGTSGSNTISVPTTGQIDSPASKVLCSGLWLFVVAAIMLLLRA